MPSPKLTMHHPDAGTASTTEAAFEALWKAKGWRKRPIKSTAKADESTTPNPTDPVAEPSADEAADS